MQCDISALSFTGAADAEGRVDRWAPSTAQTWDSACRDGWRFAREAVEYMAATGDLNLLPAVARRMAARGVFGGTEIGFFTCLAELATMRVAGEGEGAA